MVWEGAEQDGLPVRYVVVVSRVQTWRRWDATLSTSRYALGSIAHGIGGCKKDTGSVCTMQE